MSTRKICTAFLLFATLSSSLQLYAQQRAGKQFYAGYGFLSGAPNDNVRESRNPLNGWHAALEVPFRGSINIAACALGFYGTSNYDTQIEHNLLVGPQLAKHFTRESVFVQGLVGLGFINSGAIAGDHSSPSSNVVFSAMAGGGVDTSFSHNLAWRVEADYLHAQYGSNSDQIHYLRGNFAHITTGLVFRF